MTDLELDVWDAWLRERQEHLEETLSNISTVVSMVRASSIP